MKKACVFLAAGFEEVEGLMIVDLLRRAGVETYMISVSGEKKVVGSHNIAVDADCLFEEMDYADVDLLMLPGGLPGTDNLMAHAGLEKLLREFYAQGRYLAAICAAPSVFGKFGFLEGRRACSHPCREDMLTGAEVLKDPVVMDENIITGRGLGAAIPLGLKLISLLIDEETAENVKNAIVYQC